MKPHPLQIDLITRERIVTLLENLVMEEVGWRRWFKRWVINAEPLRNDAADILQRIREQQPDAEIEPRCSR